MLISTDILQLPSLARAEGVRERKAIEAIFRTQKILNDAIGVSSVYNFKLIHVQITFGA